MRLTFDQYKGEDLADIPVGYLKGLEQASWLNPELRAAINHEIARREGDRPGMGRAVKKGEARRPGKVRFDS